jgi:hypothetical protein
VAVVEKRPRRRRLMRIAVLLAVLALAHPVLAAGIDSRAYTCSSLQALIAAQRFVFISWVTFGDFVVADSSVCEAGDIIQVRSVLTADQPECPVNYCVGRGKAQGGGGM